MKKRGYLRINVINAILAFVVTGSVLFISLSSIGKVNAAAAPNASWTYWTEWKNRDNPGGVGDYETRSSFPDVCAEPVGIQCQTLNGVDWTQTGEKVTCTPNDGLVCRNADQRDGRCEDYKVRFLCPLDMSNPENPMDFIGEYHNKALDEVIDHKADWEGKDTRDILVLRLITNYVKSQKESIEALQTQALAQIPETVIVSLPPVSVIPVPLPPIPVRPGRVNAVSVNPVLDPNEECLTDLGYEFLGSIDELLYNIPKDRDVMKFVDSMKTLEHQLRYDTKLKKSEKVQLLSVSSVARNSAAYWATETALADSSRWYSVLNDYPCACEEPPVDKVPWWVIVGADVLGALSSLSDPNQIIKNAALASATAAGISVK